MAYDDIIETAGMSTEDLRSVGWFPGEEADAVMGTVDGIEVTRHPHAILRDDEDVASMVDLWLSCGGDALPVEAFEKMSAWEVDAWATMRAAHNREEKRRVKALRDKFEDEHGGDR